jgi:hypothetical protein
MGRGSTRRHSPSVLLRLECSNMRCCNSSPSSRAGNPHACDSIRFPPDPEEASFPRPGNTTSIFVAIHQCPARWSAEREGGSIHVRTMRPRGTELLGMAGPTRTACSHYLSDPARPSPIYPSYIEVVGHRTPKHILPRNWQRQSCPGHVEHSFGANTRARSSFCSFLTVQRRAAHVHVRGSTQETRAPYMLRDDDRSQQAQPRTVLTA